jgi:hypothetical protein
VRTAETQDLEQLQILFAIHSTSTFREYTKIFYLFEGMISSSIISEIVNPHRRWGSPCADSGRTAEFTRTAEVTRNGGGDTERRK